MRMSKIWLLLAGLVMVAGMIIAQDHKPDQEDPYAPDGSMIVFKLSGPGAVNDSTIKAGEKVSFDIWMSNLKPRRGLSIGFKLTSDDIKKIIHPADSGNGINKRGDVKGYNGWQDKSIFDLTGVLAAEKDWDGMLPDTLGFGALVVKNNYEPHDMMKTLSFDVIIPTPGTLHIDSTYFPPGGNWQYGLGGRPGWGGPYTYTVIK